MFKLAIYIKKKKTRKILLLSHLGSICFVLKALYFANADFVSACYRILAMTNKDFDYMPLLWK